MKTLVTYISQTGNTKKIADAIYSSLKDEKEIKKIEEIENLDGYDLTFIGYPINGGSIPPKVEEFLSSKTKGKNIAVFITHAVPEGFEDITKWKNACTQSASNANLIGEFDCQGELAQPIIDQLSKSDNPAMKSFAEEIGPSSKGKPDESCIQKAQEFAKEIQSKI